MKARAVLILGLLVALTAITIVPYLPLPLGIKNSLSLPHVFATTPTLAAFNNGAAFGTGSQGFSVTIVNANDLLVVTSAWADATNFGTLPTISDSKGSTWTLVGSCLNLIGNGGSLHESDCMYFATVGSTGSDTITIGWSGTPSFGIQMQEYEFTGFSNWRLDSSNTGSGSGTAQSTASTAYGTQDALVATWINQCTTSNTAGAGFTAKTPTGFNSQASQYSNSSSVTSPTTFPATACQSGNWSELGAAFTVGTTTQPLKVTMSNSAPSKTVTVNGCSPSPSTFAADGSVHNIAMTPSCSFYESFPAGNSTARYGFSVSSVFNAHSANITSSSSEVDLTGYLQLNNTMRANPQSPTTWNSAYSFTAHGTYLGIGSTSICTFTTTNGGGVKGCAGYADYNLGVALPSTFADVLTGTWTGSPPVSFTDITGGNTHTVNYLLSNLTSNVVTVSWINGPMNTSVTINLVKINTGTSIGLANPILASYFLNGNSTVNLVTGSNTFQVQQNTIVTVAGCSEFSNTTVRWCLINAIPFSFSSGTGVTVTLDYWIQNNDSYRWIPPVACANCGLQRPFVFYNSFSILLNTQLAANVGGTTSPTPFVSVWIDNLTSWSTTNPFNYNLSPYTPNATGSISISAPKFLTISYSGTTGCPTTNDPFSAFVCGDYVLGLFLSYGNTLTVGWFLAFVLMAFDAYIWLKSNNPGLTLTFLFIEFALFAGVGLGVGGTSTSFLSSSVWQVALVFLTIFLAGSVYRLFVGRRDGG